MSTMLLKIVFVVNAVGLGFQYRATEKLVSNGIFCV